MGTPLNWTREETYKLISVRSKGVIQEQLKGCRRNSQVYSKIADHLREPDFSRSLEQCQDKIKKIKGEHKKVRDKREKTGEGQYSKWEYFDSLNGVLGPKHSTEPPTVVESLPPMIGPDDETQDMSGETEVPVVDSPAPSHTSSSSTLVNTDEGETQKSVSVTQRIQPAESKNKSRKRKQGKNETSNELLEQMITMQKTSDQMMMLLKKDRWNWMPRCAGRRDSSTANDADIGST